MSSEEKTREEFSRDQRLRSLAANACVAKHTTEGTLPCEACMEETRKNYGVVEIKKPGGPRFFGGSGRRF